jgi:hypothetical protein
MDMATFAEVSDLRDWSEDTLGEFLKRFEMLDGEEDELIMAQLLAEAACVRMHGLAVIAKLEEILVIKKKDEFEP